MKKITALVLLILIFISSPKLSFAGGDEVHNGGGIAEQNFTFVWLNLSSTLQACATLRCANSSDELSLLKNLQTNLSAEQLPKHLIFASAKQKPTLFSYNPSGYPKEIGTTAKVGATLYINTDLIYHGSRLSLPDTVGVAMNLMILGLCEHYPNTSLATAASLAKKLSLIVGDRAEVIEEDAIEQPLVRALVWSDSSYPSQISVGDDIKQTDFTTLIAANLICPNSATAGNTFSLSAIQWSDALAWTGTEQPLVLAGSITYACASGSTNFSVSAEIQMILDFSPTLNGKLDADENWMQIPGVQLRLLNSVPQIIISNIQPHFLGAL